MGYWKWVVDFHERVYRKSPTGEEGLNAVKFLRIFFEKRGVDSLPRKHPLHNRLGVAAEPNYLWLAQYVKKIQRASSLSGFEQVARRLVNPKEYLAANNEMEVALKLYLEGLKVSFVSVDAQHTPDLILKLDNHTTRIEVSSLNPPDEETRFHIFLDQILHLSFSREVVLGGYVNRIPSAKMTEKLVNEVKESINISKKAHKVEKLNFKGVATIYIAPHDLVGQLPADCRGSFHFFGPPKRKPIELQIRQKIENKSKQLFGEDEFGLLFLYTQMIGRQRVTELFKNDADDIVVMLASYPKLLGLILTVSNFGVEVISFEKSDTLKSEFKKNKIFLDLETGKYQYESVIVWKNLHADRNFPEEILHALKNYSSNLISLDQSPE
jgi:hypothetical protein